VGLARQVGQGKQREGTEGEVLIKKLKKTEIELKKRIFRKPFLTPN
jgi:hypothetical protein